MTTRGPEHDDDLDAMSAQGLRAEVLKLRAVIRLHRDASGHNLCWFVPELWNALPERKLPQPEVPPTAEFLSRCRQFRASLERLYPLRTPDDKPCTYCNGAGSDPVEGRCPACRPYCDRCQERWSTKLSDDCPRCNPKYPTVEKRIEATRPMKPVESIFLDAIRLAAASGISYEKMFQFLAWEWMHVAPKQALIPTSFEPASTQHEP